MAMLRFATFMTACVRAALMAFQARASGIVTVSLSFCHQIEICG
jgi:hypothetical protein